MAATPSAKPETAYDRVGRLASFGLTEPWQVALLMPTGFDDLRKVEDCVAACAHLDRAVVELERVGPINARFSRGVPYTRVQMRDGSGQQVEATGFGDSAAWAEILGPTEPAHYLVQPGQFQGRITVRLIERIEPEWVGRLRPRYPGKPNYMPPARVREKVVAGLPSAVRTAAGAIAQQLRPLVRQADLMDAAGLAGWTLEQALSEVHLPASPVMAARARDAVHRVAAFAALAKAHEHAVRRQPARALDLRTWSRRMAALPFTCTQEQRQVVLDIKDDMARPEATRRMLQADVGCGKSAPIQVAAVATVDAGGRAAILLPNLPIAEQMHREIQQSWPDIGARLVTGDSDAAGLEKAGLLVGTTALLSRKVGRFDLVVVDEEHKFANHQREKLAQSGAHMVSSTATCIPRSLALVRYGAMAVSVISKQHVEKNVVTRLWSQAQRRELMVAQRATVAEGHQLLVVYPMREAGGEVDELLSIEVASKAWERMFPGQVRVLTGDDDDTTKARVLEDMREGRAQILVATTVVETGVTLPGLRRITIVAPERHALNSLHQLRGRVARMGGDGFCDLYSPAPLTERQQTKLEAFLRCADGFEVAELDLRLRGFGDLGVEGTKQSGSDDGFLYASAILPEHVAPMERLWEQAVSSNRAAEAPG